MKKNTKKTTIKNKVTYDIIKMKEMKNMIFLLTYTKITLDFTDTFQVVNLGTNKIALHS